ncbi:prepilin peptidase [Bacillus cereus group sp. TH152-1LC]|uniref:prepilin peptidase n=1 Tax=Bacillus cereus group sp. TH152-1LC TaxID=3018060 RepID=UPI0022E7A2EC|nr:prepilin peptidase [Bacillus cereus group sp. TH152-1LC]MDA1674836.1 prepilin peptidase [Bacillus cereus group sp. TH152-1LC]
MEKILFFSLLPILIISSIWDIYRNKKIPNALILLGIILGYTYSFVHEGWRGLLISILTSLVVLILGVFLLWGTIAAGDVKLLIVIATYIGLLGAGKVLLCSFFIGSIFFILFKWKRLTQSLKMVVNFAFYFVPIRMYSKEKAVAFSPFITIAYILVVFI